MSNHAIDCPSPAAGLPRAIPLAPDRRPPHATLPAVVPKEGQQLQTTLQEALGAACDLVARGATGWQRSQAGDALVSTWQPVSRELAQALDQHFAPDSPACADWDGASQLVIVPVPGRCGWDCAVVGVVPSPVTPLVKSLIAAVARSSADKVRLEQSESRAVDFMRQVTVDFEELTWLRSVAQQIGVCAVDHDIADVAAAVLPSLCELIVAETILLLPLASHATGQAVDVRPTYVAGSSVVSPARCLEVIERFGQAALAQPVVRNLSFCDVLTENDLGLRSFILTHVGQGDHQFGWLIAINRRTPDADRGLGQSQNASCHSASEFGTGEAGMVAAAGVLLGNHTHNVAAFREQEDLFRGTVTALVNSIDAKDPYTCGHSDRVAQMARRLARELQFSDAECEQIYMTGLLHDIGKIGVPDEVLLKPGKLTDEEFALIKKHPKIGHAIFQDVSRLSYALPGVLHHHESYDGRGYPAGLAGDQIPLPGRLVAVVDSYDAMTSNRPYRAGMPTARAEEVLRGGAGQQWDPLIVQAFFRVLADIRAICGFTADGDVRPPLVASAKSVPNEAEPRPAACVVGNTSPPINMMVPS